MNLSLVNKLKVKKIPNKVIIKTKPILKLKIIIYKLIKNLMNN